MRKILVIIPARGGSKGIPHKNIKLMNGKPLILYSIDVARELVHDIDICVSTDEDEIIDIVERYGLEVPFKRPEILATDTATTNDVLLHAINYYRSIGACYELIVLLQPTSPLRKINHLREALALYKDSVDMVVSVKESSVGGVLCVEDELGYLEPVFNKRGGRRQDMQSFYEYNGAIYIININALERKGLQALDKKIKYIMPIEDSIDIDNQYDWDIAEYLLMKQ
ncbi:cytidylyltransferase domain-containing protein [Dysgonomonas sp. HGC4]|uniref:acylneuraminate cytidylyltransferase family protein n=1 Tax=Dysgonomonas sp. HGC4 TaxID=1658009 RepID=UPI000682B460|nr:acylneuraminate cytidylyltransferase family protein [Dysgonomonas sp. HGC4]MBD8349069.1 acylneuraminate cytidylyltransferase family protein [Dysgonomonas sp. HGC4]